MKGNKYAKGIYTRQPSIEVGLISATSPLSEEALSADRLLVYTKATRLEQGEKSRKRVASMSKSELAAELKYMTTSIPSSWEMVDYVFEIRNVTRAFTHQFVRTRHGSYAQQSLRVLSKKQFTFRIPPRLMPKGLRLQRSVYTGCMTRIQSAYNKLLEAGVLPEDARGLLPMNIHTNIIAKFNLRTLAEMAKSRTGKRTQDEYREVMDLMLEAVVVLHPWARQFLFPESGNNIKAVEQAVESAAQRGGLSQQEKIVAFKHLDALRKGNL